MKTLQLLLTLSASCLLLGCNSKVSTELLDADYSLSYSQATVSSLKSGENFQGQTEFGAAWATEFVPFSTSPRSNFGARLGAYNNSQCTVAASGALAVDSNPVALMNGIFSFTGISYTNSSSFEDLIYLQAKNTTKVGGSPCIGPININHRFNAGFGYSVFDNGGPGIYPAMNVNSDYREDNARFIYTDSLNRSLVFSSMIFNVYTDPTFTSGKYTSRIAILRYMPDGTLDNTFGTNGVRQIMSNGSTIGGLTAPSPEISDPTFASDEDYIGNVLVDSQGRFVIVGNTTVSGFAKNGFVVRLTAAGVLDSSFADNGIYIYNKAGIGFSGRALSSKYDFFSGLAEDSMGRLVVVGGSNNPAGGTETLILRLTANGALDTSFNTTGFALYNSGGTGLSGLANASKYDYLNSILITSDNKYLGVATSQASLGNRTFFVSYNADGSLNTGFNLTGVSMFNYNIGTSIAGGSGARQIESSSLILNPAKNKFYMYGSSRNSSNKNEAYVCKFDLSSAQLDTGFMQSGCYIPKLNATGFAGHAPLTRHEYYRGIVFDSVGNLILAGNGNSGSTYYGFVTKLKSNDVLDSQFASSGHLLTTDWLNAITVDRKDRILISGEHASGNASQWPVATSRLLSNGVLDQ